MKLRQIPRHNKFSFSVFVSVCVGILLPANLLMAAPPKTIRASVSTIGVEANQSSASPTLSGNGRYLAFDSEATNLVAGDNNEVSDVFIHDRKTGETARVSVNSQQIEAIGGLFGEEDLFLGSFNPDISRDGRLVAFESISGNLVDNDANLSFDIFIHDVKSGLTTRESINSSGVEADSHSFSPDISADGRFLAFHSYADNLVSNDVNDTVDVFIRDRLTGAVERESVGVNGEESNGASLFPDISDDGRYVAFMSLANDLVAEDNNGVRDVFVRDRLTGLTRRISVGSSGEEANDISYIPAISGNGRYVAFSSDASNLVPGDLNGATDIFVHDLTTGTTQRVSVDSKGREGDLFSFGPALSANGRFLTFSSDADNLVARDINHKIDVFVHDLKTHKTRRLSMNRKGIESNGDSFQPVLSANGRFVAFSSDASNLVSGDIKGARDIFFKRRR